MAETGLDGRNGAEVLCHSASSREMKQRCGMADAGGLLHFSDLRYAVKQSNARERSPMTLKLHPKSLLRLLPRQKRTRKSRHSQMRSRSLDGANYLSGDGLGKLEV